MVKHIFLTLLLVALASCTSSTPKKTSNICSVFNEKDDWYDQAKNAYQKWGIPINASMAIMYQESRFVADAQPPRPWLLGIIPWFRSSSAYGYPQAQDGTWNDYLKHKQSHWSADRDDFADACDFIGWYCAISHKKLGISLLDTEKLYLAYHEGHAGYSQKSYLKKPWLIKTAKKVSNKSKQYQNQLLACKDDLESSHWFFW